MPTRHPFRPAVEQLAGYVPGEQPRDAGWVKLNTNESPYPPSPRVVAALAQAASGRLNLYPDPLATRFREVAAGLFGVDPDWVLPGNGSDEILTILVRSFVDPGERIAYPYPSYVLYETLAEIQGASVVRVPLREDWSWDTEASGARLAGCKLLFVPNPNSPSGHRFPDAELREVAPPEGLLVLDEAYGDFADKPHAGELLQDPALAQRLVITRTLSKSYSLAGLRIGFALAHPDLVAGMRKVKDSYNCDTLSLVAGTAALEDRAWLQETLGRIQATRGKLVDGLKQRGFAVVDSQANFVWATHADGEHQRRFAALKDRRVLVRYMVFADEEPGWDGLRITVGTDEEIDRLLQGLDEID